MARFWRHKHGNIYRDLGEVKLMASDLTKLQDGSTMVCYVDEMGRRSVRLREEFHDGRFTKVLEFDTRKSDKHDPK